MGQQESDTFHFIVIALARLFVSVIVVPIVVLFFPYTVFTLMARSGYRIDYRIV